MILFRHGYGRTHPFIAQNLFQAKWGCNKFITSYTYISYICIAISLALFLAENWYVDRSRLVISWLFDYVEEVSVLCFVYLINNHHLAQWLKAEDWGLLYNKKQACSSSSPCWASHKGFSYRKWGRGSSKKWGGVTTGSNVITHKPKLPHIAI